MMKMDTPQAAVESGDHYWLREGEQPWRAVSRDEFAEAERRAGFHPKQGCGPLATAGFGSSVRNVQGRITDTNTPPESLTDPLADLAL